MVEKSPAGWTEEQLGAKLLQLIKDMKGHLMTKKLSHYFISKKNMFEVRKVVSWKISTLFLLLFKAIPQHKLLKAHEKFHRLQENLVPFLMRAIKRLHIDKFFYPLPDVEELYNILTTRDTLAMLNPSLLETAGAMKEATNAFER